jgi:hypothetical protein
VKQNGILFIKKCNLGEKIWKGPTSKTWDYIYKNQCDYLGNPIGLSIRNCKNACREKQNCTAIIFSFRGCILLGCSLPVPVPTFDHRPSYNGYYMAERKYYDKFARCLHRISLIKFLMIQYFLFNSYFNFEFI